MCNAYECPFRNDMGYCKVTACIRRDLAEKYNTAYTSNATTAGVPTATNYTIQKIDEVEHERQ